MNFWRRKWWSWIFNYSLDKLLEKMMVTNFQSSNSFWMNFRKRKWWLRIFNPVEFSIIKSFLKKKMMVTNFQPNRIFNYRILFGWIFRGRKRIFNHQILFEWIFEEENNGYKFSIIEFSLNKLLKKKMMIVNFQLSNLWMNFRRRKWWSRIPPLNFREKLKRTLEKKMKEESRTRF